VAPAWIVLIVIGGLASAVLILWLVVRRLRERKAANLALRDFAARHGFKLRWEQVRGHDTSNPVLRGELDGLPLVIDEYTRGGETSIHLTRWSVTSPGPWPGGLVAYTPGFHVARGGPHGTVQDNREPIHSYWARVNDHEIGDPELDELLAIDGTDLDKVRAILLAPGVKRAVLDAVQAFEHIRIQGGETTIELEGVVASVEQMEEVARHVTAVARAIGAACCDEPASPGAGIEPVARPES